MPMVSVLSRAMNIIDMGEGLYYVFFEGVDYIGMSCNTWHREPNVLRLKNLLVFQINGMRPIEHGFRTEARFIR